MSPGVSSNMTVRMSPNVAAFKRIDEIKSSSMTASREMTSSSASFYPRPPTPAVTPGDTSRLTSRYPSSLRRSETVFVLNEDDNDSNAMESEGGEDSASSWDSDSTIRSDDVPDSDEHLDSDYEIVSDSDESSFIVEDEELESDDSFESDSSGTASPTIEPVIYYWKKSSPVNEPLYRGNINEVIDNSVQESSVDTTEAGPSHVQPVDYMYLTTGADGHVPRNGSMLGKAAQEYKNSNFIGPVIRVGEKFGTALLS